MPAAYVPMDIDQGEDFTTDIVWTDNFDEPVEVIHPCRMDIKGSNGQTIVILETNFDLPEGEIPKIAISTSTGLIQLHLTKEETAAIAPGQYFYDLFVTSDDGNEYSGVQTTRLLYGEVTVNKRFTRMV